ncbi:MAG TPA: hypothetical protein VHV30_00015 [Polyangiaceae bacterium]|nr:hypothetical protein [Polyangiaceae bacterium]
MKGWKGRARAGVAALCAAAVVGCARPASAETFVPELPPLRLVGIAGGGGGGRTRGFGVEGPYAGAEAGAAWGPVEGGTLAPAFGARAGYALRSGVALDLRFDDEGLGVDGAPATDSRVDPSVLAGGAGVAYAFPFAFVRPFAEAHLGLVSMGGATHIANEVGAGLLIPVSDALAIDVGVRDWIFADRQTLENLPAVSLGLDLGTFG